jgi:hypothetical protein
MKYRILIFTLVALSTITAVAQDQSPRTWIGGGVTFAGTTAERSQTITGAYVDSAYDLRHGFQARFTGAYLNNPIIPNLFTGEYGPTRAESELRYKAVLVGYLPVEPLNKVFVGGGVSTIRHFFDRSPGVYRSGGPYRLYNSSVNPTAVAGVRLGGSEAIFSYYFPDTYSYSGLRGFGGEFSHTRKISGYLHLHFGVEGRYHHYREGNETRGKRAGEVRGFVGFRFQ